jgi:hypothetical protein
VMDNGASTRASHERDFLEELQRQREQVTESSVGRDDDIAALVSAPRTVGTSAAPKPTTYDADDLEIPSFLRRK